jgi:hypothetical protein
MKGDSEWVPNELHLPPILSRPKKPPRSSPIDINSTNMTHSESRAQLLPDHSDGDGDGDLRGKSPSSSILTPHKMDQGALALSFLPYSPQGGSSNAPQPPIVTHTQSGLSTALSTSKPRAKVKYRRIVNIASSASKRDDV